MPDEASTSPAIAAHQHQAAANLSALIESTEDYVWSVDLNFRLAAFNSGLRQYFEQSFATEAAIGKLPEELLPPDRAAIWPPLYRRALAEGPFRVEIPFPGSRTLEMSLNPIVVDGQPSGVSIFGRDITERKKAEKGLREAEHKYRDIFNGALEGMFQISTDSRVLTSNPALARMFGYDSPVEFKAQVHNVVEDLWVDADEYARYLQLANEHGEVSSFECRLRRKDGSIFWGSLDCRSVRAPSGEVLYRDGFLRNITERKRTEEALRDSEESLLESQRLAGLGSYIGDLQTGLWHCSEVLKDILGVGEDYAYTIEAWVSLIHPDDRESMAAYFQEEVLGKRQNFDREYRIVRARDNAERWVHGIGKLELNPDGEPIRLRGVIRDITERRRGDMQLRESELRYRSTFEQAPIGIVHTSSDGRFLRCNARFAQIVGYSQEEIVGMCFQQITAPEDLAASLAKLDNFASRAGGASCWEKRYLRKNGTLVWVRITTSAQYGDDGNVVHHIALVEDIDELKAAQQRLQGVQLALRLSEERYRTAFQTSIDSITISRSVDGTYVEVNKAFLDIMGYERQEVIGHSSLALGVWADPADRQRMLDELQRNSFCRDLDVQFRRKSGEIFPVRMSSSLVEIQGVPCNLSITRDVSAAKAAEKLLTKAAEALRLSEERYRTVFQTSLDPILINRTSDRRFIDVNQAFLDVMGFDREEVIGRTSLDLNLWNDPRDLEIVDDLLERDLECRNIEIQFRKKSGETLWGLMSASVVEIDGVQCVLTITRDISNVKAAEDEIRNLAFYDPLTGLPNRRLLLERLHLTLVSSARTGRLRALLFVDLDNFKTLNDTLGHQTGDLLLQEAARRLVACVRESDTVGRLGGDEFVLMLEDLSEKPEEAAAQAKAVGEKILGIVAQPYLLNGRECRSGASIGISVFGDRRESSTDVLQQADIAMYQSKAAGRNTMRFFAPALQAAVNARAALEDDMRQAIKANQFVLFFQPQIDRNRLFGAEALLRWNHPRTGILPPGEFIPLAEETGLILPLGKWVLEAACAQIAAWSEGRNSAKLAVAVNISVRQFRQPEFVEQVLSAIERTGANPRNLRLELTESILVENVEDVIGKMKELKSHGLRFSLDDFGTGYSSLAYLKKLPLDQLKIDRSFIRDLLTDESSAAIAQTIVSLSRAMGLPVIAEGVETEEQREFLIRLGCHAFQGYLFSRPLPLNEFEEQWLGSSKEAMSSAG